MPSEKFMKYVELFSQFYKEDKVSAKWGKELLSFRPSINLEEELKKIDPSYNEEEFVDVAFTILRVIRDFSNGVSPKADEEKVQIITEVFLSNNHDILEHVRIHASSVVNTFEDIDYEVTTKRSKKDPNIVISKSIVLSLIYNDPMKPDTNNRFALEISTKELKEIMKALEDALETIEKIDR